MRRVCGGPVSADAQASSPARLQSLVEARQLQLILDQLRRLVSGHLAVDAFVAWMAWRAGLGLLAWLWLLGIVALVVGRDLYVRRLQTQGRMDSRAVLLRLANLLTLFGAAQVVVVVMVFSRPPGDAQYILTMVMMGLAAGAVTAVAGHLRSFLPWGVVFFGGLALCWLSRMSVEGVAVALLVLSLFATLVLSVRDQGRTLANLVSLSEELRHERDKQLRLAEELRLARDRAERASQAKTRFFASASHDLRQPLTALSFNAATLRLLALRLGDDDLSQVSDGIRRALAESQGLLDSVLEVSKLDAGTIDVQFGPVELGALLVDLAAPLMAVAAGRGLVLRVQGMGAALLWVQSDAQLLRRILHNLVGNAIKFTPSGSVTLSAEPDAANAVRISVSDTGPGIAPEVQDKVFEEFFQLGNVERNRSRGLGLGLAIVRRLAALLGGEVGVHSALGQGATFWLRLPRDEPAVPAPSALAELAELAAPTASVAQRPARVFRVLVIDDERAIREALGTFLRTLGWTAVTASDSDEALHAWHGGFLPEALLIDFRLREGASGLGALDALRGAGCTAPAWLITGDTEPGRIAQARAAGLPVVYKPVQGHELVALVRAVLDPLERA